MKKASIMNRFFVVFCFFIFTSLAACRKDNKQLYGDWQFIMTSTSGIYLEPNCRIWTFKKFGRIIDYTGKDGCKTADQIIQKGKYKYIDNRLIVKFDKEESSFFLTQTKEDDLFFKSETDTTFSIVLIKL